MQKTKTGITFILDESMVDYLENRTVFVLSVDTDNDDNTSIILAEQSV